MKKVISLSFALFLLSTLSFAQTKGLGVGLMLGEPAGLSANYYTSQNNSFAIGLGASPFEEGSKIAFHIDYLHYNEEALKNDLLLDLYYGFGLRNRFKSGETGSFGVRGVIGAIWRDNYNPLEVFLEVAPVFRLFPSTGINLDIAIGFRWYFAELSEL